MSVLLAAPLLLSLTLLVSGLAKLGAREGTEDAMTSLRLPLPGAHRTVATILPVAEIVLAVTLWVPVAGLQTAAAAAVAALMVAYLVIIARALGFEETVECSCFGTLASPTVSLSTLWRNLILSGLGGLAVIAALSGVTARAVLEAPLPLLGWAGALALTVALTALALGGTDRTGASDAADGPDAAPAAAPVASAGEGHADAPGQGADLAAEDEELMDYERDPIPAGVLQRPDGGLVTLRQLTAQQAALLIFVSEGCGPCERVLDRFPGWLAQLSPFMQVKVAFRRPVDGLRERTEQRVGDHALHDPQFSAREALGAKTAPSAVLLGADGLLAGGPVTGGSGVIEFVDEIQEQLAAAQHEGELPASEPEPGREGEGEGVPDTGREPEPGREGESEPGPEREAVPEPELETGPGGGSQR